MLSLAWLKTLHKSEIELSLSVRSAVLAVKSSHRLGCPEFGSVHTAPGFEVPLWVYV